MSAAPVGRDLAQITLGVLFMLILILASGWVVLPFVPATVWAAMLVIATWPILMKVQAMAKGRRGVAVTVMTLALLLVFVIPLLTSIGAIVSNADRMAAWAQDLAASTLPQPPAWVAGIPLVGRRIAASWVELAALPREELTARVAPYSSSFVRWLIGRAGGVAGTLVQLLLILGIAPMLWAWGETAADGIKRFAHRVAGARGEESVVLAAQAIRAVALGVVITALIQSVLAGLGLLLTGVPFAGILSAVALLSCIAQLGPAPVLVPAVIWLYWSGHPVAGTILAVWTLIVGVLDNVIRPLLIKRGANLPLLLILTGVIGGLIAFGVVGLFVGPVVLAVTYTLLAAWVRGDPAPHTAPVAPLPVPVPEPVPAPGPGA